ncbi:asparagine synthase (glutamine-hydrolyzing) [Saliterribacillus persicus]|uniref:asparagine synthase (glutamine-hydrolyzing) n=1 Tax=Saliterribacillus persicus TaxID=930114 RepID=A0A368XNX1_9BACI|nr:asparagine synthase (glutamine-hydrolyzing) [Saliterribacillus persicus]RCW69712.1 asparagine synthase (glutamine-hydrolysing) [Saliterribacillus persicus]
MCGITGWIDYKKDLRNEEKNILRMTTSLKHRGPDEENTWLSPHAAFGHQRLIVIDPDGGKQPMQEVHNGETYTLVYNGELYNTDELRNALSQLGWRFKGHSDTEVLLKSYIEWKEACVERFNGIFAFAIWSEKKKQLFLARDRLGVKPLFYTEMEEGLLFGSEIKALLAHSQITPTLDQEGLSEIFALGPSRTPGNGVFQGIHELRAAHVGIFDENGLKTKRYWNVKSEPHVDNTSQTVSMIKSLFLDAVERQLVSDVPLGTFLSGGIDSSAITAVATRYLQKEGKPNLHTFSIDYEENDKYFKTSDFQPNHDQPFIEKMVSSLNTDHHRFVIDQNTLVDLLKTAVYYRDLPGMADVDASLLWLCQESKKHVTVALSGECADEIFGGYPWFKQTDDLNRNAFPWIRSSELRHNLLRENIKNTLDLEGYMKKRYHETIKETPVLEGETDIEKARREMFYLNMHWFMPTLLDRKDRMSMGAGFEARVPFSDHRLVEYVWNIPFEMKQLGGREKGIFREALTGYVPDEILFRKKSPYPKTHHPAYTKAVVDWMNEIIKDKDSRLFEVLDRTEVKKMVEQDVNELKTPWFGQLMAGPQLLAHLAQIDHWLKTYDIKLKI